MTQEFANWTDYDNWLIQNYEPYAFTSVNEIDGKIVVEYIDKAEWEAQQRDKSDS